MTMALPHPLTTTGRPRARRRAAVLLAVLLGLVVLVVLLTARPAQAHSGGPQPTNFRTRVLAVQPPIPGLTLRAVDASSRLELTNTGPAAVTVLGYDGEPYLRVGPDGVFENRRSPAVYRNRDLLGRTPVPAEADPRAAPDWRRIGGHPVVTWHDHRAHWMAARNPPQVTAAPDREHVVDPRWTVELRSAGRRIAVTGDLRWVPGPSPWPWVGAAIGCGLLAVAAGSRRSWPVLVAMLAAALIAADAVHAVGIWLGTSGPLLAKLPASLLSFGWWGLGVVAAWRLLRLPDPSWGLIYLLLMAALALITGGLQDMPELVRSQLPGALPGPLARGAVAATLGLATGLLVAGGLRMWQSQSDQDRDQAELAARSSRPHAVDPILERTHV
jgi:hypothetical protein